MVLTRSTIHFLLLDAGFALSVECFLFSSLMFFMYETFTFFRNIIEAVAYYSTEK